MANGCMIMTDCQVNKLPLKFRSWVKTKKKRFTELFPTPVAPMTLEASVLDGLYHVAAITHAMIISWSETELTLRVVIVPRCVSEILRN
jgi:hypothetical protein